MILIPLLALGVGVAVGLLLLQPVEGWLATYLALMVLAGLDTVFGGARAALEGKYYGDVFVSGFLANVAIAGFLAWLGDRIGIDLFLAAVVFLGMRIFNNLSLIRRLWLTRMADNRRRRRLDAEQERRETVGQGATP